MISGCSSCLKRPSDGALSFIVFSAHSCMRKGTGKNDWRRCLLVISWEMALWLNYGDEGRFQRYRCIFFYVRWCLFIIINLAAISHRCWSRLIGLVWSWLSWLIPSNGQLLPSSNHWCSREFVLFCCLSYRCFRFVDRWPIAVRVCPKSHDCEWYWWLLQTTWLL